MTITATSMTPAASQSLFGKATDVVKKGVKWADEYTRPRTTTAGNFDEASYFQAALQGGTEGFYLMGPLGAVPGAGSAILGAFVQNKTRSMALGVTTGTALGAALGIGVAALTGAPIQGMATLGAVIGGFQTIRAHGASKVRDAGGNATMVSAFWVPGPAKVAGGIGAAMGVRMKSRPMQALVGAATGAAVGAAFSAIGFAPVGIAASAIGSGLAGAVGPFLGPRFSQFFRNLAEDLGNLVQKALNKPNMSDATSNAIGAVPAAFIKEGMRGFQMSDGGLWGFVIGGAMESIQQAHIMWASRKEKKEDLEQLAAQLAATATPVTAGQVVAGAPVSGTVAKAAEEAQKAAA